MDRITKWKTENRDRDLSHKKAWRDRQKARREAVASAAQKQETNIR